MNTKTFITGILIICFTCFDILSFAELVPLEEKWQKETIDYLEKLNRTEEELHKFITKNEKYMRFEEQTISLLAYQTLEVWRTFIAWFGNSLYIKEKYVDNGKSKEMYLDNFGKCANLFIVAEKTKSFLNQTSEKTRYKELKIMLNRVILELNNYLENIKIDKTK